MADPPPDRRRRTPRPGAEFLRRRGTPVDQTRIRELFQEARILERLDAGELTEVVLRENPPDPNYNQDPGTVSQLVEYRDQSGHMLAQAHRYLKPDGSLGGSGLPDPKRVLHLGVLYILNT